MPSSVIAQVAEIKNLRSHPDADKLDICEINGWQLVCGKGSYEEGSRVVYITPDSLITEQLADILEIRQHLGSVKNEDGTFVTNENGEVMLRVKQAKLRGEPSFGTTIPTDVMFEHYAIDINEKQLGENLAEAIGIMKYEPRMKASAGDAEVDNILFQKYTSIENIRNFPNIFEEGEPVSISLKLHGTNCRVGYVEGEPMAGSHALRRKRPVNIEANTYWFPHSLESVKNFFNAYKEVKQVIIYGEVYGASIQKGFAYDAGNKLKFRAFDILLEGKYLDVEDFYRVCEYYGIEVAPRLDIIGYNYKEVTEFIENLGEDPLGGKVMEGAVIKPLKERTDRRVGRVVLKYITNSYLFGKNIPDSKDV